MIGILACFTGKVVSDPNATNSSSGKPMLRVLVAVDDRVPKKGERDQLVSVVVLGELATALRGRVGRGASVYAEGRLQTSSWRDKATGETRHGLTMWCDRLDVLGEGIRRRRPEGGGTDDQHA